MILAVIVLALAVAALSVGLACEDRARRTWRADALYRSHALQHRLVTHTHHSTHADTGGDL